MFKITRIIILEAFPIVLAITIPIRAIKDKFFPNFNPQEWPFISSNGFLNRVLAGHCFEIFLIMFIILNSFKFWIVSSKSPILPTMQNQSIDENNQNNQNNQNSENSQNSQNNQNNQNSQNIQNIENNRHVGYYEILKKSKSDLHLLKQIESLQHPGTSTLKYTYLQLIKLVSIYLPLSILIIWFFGPSIYEKIHYITGGYCKNHPDFKYYRKCVENGYEYLGGFKSSGHSLISTTFASCILFEIVSLYTWINYINLLNKLSVKILRVSYIFVIVSLFIYLCWITMFTITCLFYHTLGERIVGTFSGCLITFFVYIKYKL